MYQESLEAWIVSTMCNPMSNYEDMSNTTTSHMSMYELEVYKYKWINPNIV